jgi:acetoin utilization deacetylase AcuC-like enzyme
VHDPFARQMLTTKGFATMTQKMMDLADKVCDGKLALIQEGGYSPFYVPFCLFPFLLCWESGTRKAKLARFLKRCPVYDSNAVRCEGAR